MSENIALERHCGWCGLSSTIIVNHEAYLAWKKGALIQEAFPYLSAEEREMIISGMHDDCFNEMADEWEKEFDA